MTSRKLIIGASALAAGLCFTAGASAQSVTEVRALQPNRVVSVTVSVDDLDLTSPAGQKVLHYRIAAAAEQACGPDDLRLAGSVSLAARNADCQAAAFSRAMARVNRSTVAALH